MSQRGKGATSVSLLFRITDSVTGKAKTGVNVTTLKLQFERPGAAVSAATSLTLLAALTTAWSAYGAKEVDATNSPGVYRVDAPDAAFALGADEVTLTLAGAGIEPSTRLIDLVPPAFPVATATGAPTATSVPVTGLASTALNAYKDAFALFESGVLGFTAAYPVIASSYSAGTTTLVFAGLPAAPAAGDTLILIGSKK